MLGMRREGVTAGRMSLGRREGMRGHRRQLAIFRGVKLPGDLIFRQVSRLDAFSGYLFRI